MIMRSQAMLIKKSYARGGEGSQAMHTIITGEDMVHV